MNNKNRWDLDFDLDPQTQQQTQKEIADNHRFDLDFNLEAKPKAKSKAKSKKSNEIESFDYRKHNAIITIERKGYLGKISLLTQGDRRVVSLYIGSNFDITQFAIEDWFAFSYVNDKNEIWLFEGLEDTDPILMQQVRILIEILLRSYTWTKDNPRNYVSDFGANVTIEKRDIITNVRI